MKLKLSLIALMVSLMTVSTFAATIDAWVQDGTTSGLYNDTAMWKKSNVPVPTTVTGDEIKISGRTNQATRDGPSIATLGQLIYDPYGSTTANNRLTLAGGGDDANTVLLKIVGGSGANAYFSEVRVGHGNNTDKGKWGMVEQTGGTLRVDKLQLGYHGSRTQVTLAKGTYTISGGTLTKIEGKTGRLMVGAGITSGTASGPATNEGVFTVIGTAATITMGDLYVGTDGTNYGKGTLAFKVASGGVSAIQLSGTTLYLGGGPNGTGVAELVVYALADAAPNANILLVDNQGVGAIGGNGVFASFNGGSAIEGRQIAMGGKVYTLTYKTTGKLGTGNDIVLLIPEPATLALLSLGLLTIRRKK